MDDDRRIAYFTMEIGLDPEVPTYSGGLGILAGDTVRSAADLRVPLVAVTLLYRKGYFHQGIDADGWQTESPVHWVAEDFLSDTGVRADVTVEGRAVRLGVRRYDVRGVGGFTVPVYFLDADLPENSGPDRELTHRLYGGDDRYRLCQEALLGIGGVRALRALGHASIARFHMNEGHSSLLALELLRERAERAGRAAVEPEDLEAAREACVFTTHTPVPAGHDRFPLDLADRVLAGHPAWAVKDALLHEGRLNMTYLALTLSRYVNGVAKKHGEVSRHLFARYQIDSITNGVHAATWVAPPFARLFDEHIPGWREDNFSLRYALSIPAGAVREAHREAKRELVQLVNRQANAGFDHDWLTIGFARRAATYKRAALIFDDVERLRRIARTAGRFQIVFAGKAHPRDEGGKRVIQRVVRAARELAGDVPVAYLPNYDFSLGRLVTAGVDVWLNTPEPPLEASGTSGMKAALNGVPSLSVLDGWWIEGCIEGVTGWAIGGSAAGDRARDAEALYAKLEGTVIPAFARSDDGFVDVMRHAIALNGSFFNTQRMMQQYVLKAYFG